MEKLTKSLHFIFITSIRVENINQCTIKEAESISEHAIGNPSKFASQKE